MPLFLKNRCFALYHAALLMATVLLLGCDAPLHTDIDIHHIESLNRAGNFGEIVREFDSYDWSRLNDPYLLLFYCNALAEVDRNIPSTLKDSTVPVHIRELSLAFYNLFRAKFPEAKEHLDKIPRGPNNVETGVWYAIGLIEYSLYTESIYYMGQPLLNLKEAVKNNPGLIPNEKVVYYDALHEYHMGRYPEFNEILEQQAKEINPYDLNELKVLAFLSKNNVNDAISITNDMLKQYPFDIGWQSIDAALLSIKHTPEERLAIYKNKADKGDGFWTYRKGYAYALAELGQHKEAVKILMELSSEHPYDYQIRLEAAQLGSHFNQYKLFARKVLRNPDYHQLPYFLFIMADLSKSSGKLEEAKEYFKFANFLYPDAQYNLWYEYKQAWDKGDINDASEVLDRIEYLYPYNSSIPGQRMELQSLSR